jgi:acyl-coenzyme A synthetase/AMP-(fatty) acid ligase
MKLAVICAADPQQYIPAVEDHCVMIVDPNAHADRKQYLIGAVDWSLLITDRETKVRTGRDYADTRLIWYTSGTTGASKVYKFSQSQLDLKIQTIIEAYDLGPDDHYVSVMPLWHGHGQGLFWASLKAKSKISFLAPQRLKDLYCFKPTWISCIPAMFPLLLKQDIPTLRFIRSSSQSLPDDMYNRLRAKFQIPIIESFGMTEGLSHSFTNPLHGQQRMGTVGLPDGIQARIDSNQNLWIKGPCVYTADWINTGDLAEQDHYGYYKILGRSIDQINVKGTKVNPLSLENQLRNQFPSLVKVAVFGRHSVKCLYVGSVPPTQIQHYLRSLGKHLHPKLLRQVDDIPVNNNGKISREHLNSLYL